MHDGIKEAVQKPAGQGVMRSWDCSQIENEEEEESWREGNQMAAPWDEEQKLDEIVERRRMEGSSLKLEVMQKVPEPVVHELTRQRGEGSQREKESTRMVFRRDEGKTNIAGVEDTEERGNGEFKARAEEFGGENGRGSLGQVQGRRKQKRGLQR